MAPVKLLGAVAVGQTLLTRKRAACEAVPAPLYRRSGDDPKKVLQWHQAGGGYVHDSVDATELPGRGWALCLRSSVTKGTVLVRTPKELLWVAHESEAKDAEPLAPGESLPKASAALRRRLVKALQSPDPFVESMHPPDSIPLRLVAGSVQSDPPEDATVALKGTSLLNHTLSLRSKLLKAVQPELELAKDMQAAWEACVWAQAVIMSRGFHVPKNSDRLLLIPIVDIANHAPTYALANAEFNDNKDGSMTMIASRDIASEEEVCVCYGEHNNEQLLFCYGFVIPDNPCQGLLCPLPFPESPFRAELLHYTLADLRKHHGRNPSAKAGPTLRRPSDSEPATSELLLALKIFGMSEEEAEAQLQADTAERLRALEANCQEWIMALNFLEAWRAEIPLRKPGSTVAEAAQAARQLQQEAEDLLEIATKEVAAQLPFPLKVRFFCLTHPWNNALRLLR